MTNKLAASLFFLATVAFATVASAQTIYVQDTFTVGANTALESHAPDTGGTWTRNVGGGITLLAANDDARNASNNNTTVYTNGTTSPNADQVIGVTVTFNNPSSNNFIDLYGRVVTSPTTTSYHARLDSNGGVTLELINGGVTTVLATGTATLAAGAHEVVLSLKSTAKEVWVDGVQIVTSTNDTNTAAGSPGLGMRGVGSGQTVGDDFYAATFSPTAIDHIDATATRDGARTLVEWTTSRELRSLGFRVHRGDGTTSRGLIAGAAFLSATAMLPAGNTYRWLDDNPRAAARYWIEEIDFDGRHAWHGPFTTTRGTIDTRVAASPTLVDLRQRDGVVTRTTLQPESLATSSRRRAVDPYARGLAKQWELAANGAAKKISIADDGMVRIAKNDLGIGDLTTARLYANGAEVPLLVDGDAIVFQGREDAVYWLVSESGTASRIPVVTSNDAATTTRTNFLATAERRDKMIFAASILSIDGDGFVGPVVSADAAHPTPQVLHLQHIDRTLATARVNVQIQGASPGEHHVTVALNGNAAGEIVFKDSTIGSGSFTVPSSQLVDGDNTINLVALNGDEDASAVLTTSITYAHTFQADDDRLLAEVEGGKGVTFTGFAGDDVQLYDLTAAPVRITPASIAGGAITFTAPGSGSRTIVALRSAGYGHASSIATNAASSLHTATATDMTIITHPSFLGALAPLVSLRQSQDLGVQVVQVDDVYDEYGFGMKSAAAIRNYLRAKTPRYALLVGDASFDEHNILGLGDFNFIPTKLVPTDLLRTASDTWFTDFDDNGVANVPIGRFPVRTIADANAIVAKIVRAEALTPSNKVVFVSDADATLDFHSATVNLKNAVPAGFTTIDINIATQGATAARQQLLSSFNDALLVNYVGHGSVELWSNAGFFSRTDAATLHPNRTPVVLAMTCLNGYFYDLYTDSLAESLLRGDGALAVFASSALTSPEAQVPVADALLRALLANPAPRLGDAIIAAQAVSNTPDIRRTFLLFGDPATKVR